MTAFGKTITGGHATNMTHSTQLAQASAAIKRLPMQVAVGTFCVLLAVLAAYV